MVQNLTVLKLFPLAMTNEYSPEMFGRVNGSKKDPSLFTGKIREYSSLVS